MKETEQDRDIVSNYVKLKKLIQEDGNDSDDEHVNIENPSNSACRGMGNNEKGAVEGGTVSCYQNDYIKSSNPDSYKYTSEGSYLNDTKRHSSKIKYYDPRMPLDDF